MSDSIRISGAEVSAYAEGAEEWRRIGEVAEFTLTDYSDQAPIDPGFMAGLKDGSFSISGTFDPAPVNLSVNLLDLGNVWVRQEPGESYKFNAQVLQDRTPPGWPERRPPTLEERINFLRGLQGKPILEVGLYRTVRRSPRDMRRRLNFTRTALFAQRRRLRWGMKA